MAIKMNAQLRGNLKLHEPMQKHTSWRTGGHAAQFYQPADVLDLSEFLRQLDPATEVYWVGLGSNLLVRDGGFNGVIICTSGVLNEIELMDEQHIRVETGVACPKVAKFSARQGLQGAEFLCGIPGTMGGALAMNAGAFGGETWNIVESVMTIDRQGEIHQRFPKEFEIAYRHVRGAPDEWFTSVILKLEKGDKKQAQAMIKSLLAKRSASQPTQQPNAGSVFRNPDGDYAARLIELAGMKGICIGGACVSDKHANFIINTGHATAGDIELLMEKVATTVKRETGVQLEREVCVVGDANL